MYPLCPYCESDSCSYPTTGLCYRKKEYNERNRDWNTLPSKWHPPKTVTPEEEIRKADEQKREEVRRRKAKEVEERVRQLLKDVLTEDELDSITVVRKDDPLVAIPASILFTIFTKHEELVEELRQIIDGLS